MMDTQQPGQTCEVAGHKLHYHKWGKGVPVLLVHGITTYSFIWRRIVQRLSEQYDVIAVDLLGCGDSDMPLDESYSVKRHAELILAFITNLNIKRFHFVGHDIGGGIGQIFAVRYPELLYDLTMINPVAYDYWPVQPITAMRTPVIRQFMMATLDMGSLRQIVKRGLYHKDRVDDEFMALFNKPLQTRAGRKAFLHFAKCLNNRHLMEIEKDLRGIAMPVLIIRGEADMYLSSEIADRLHQEISQSQLLKVPTGGHFIQEDEPEILIEALIKFFAESEDDSRL